MTTDYEPPLGFREPFQLAADERPDANAWYAFDDGFDTKEQAIEAQRRMHERGVAEGTARERAAAIAGLRDGVSGYDPEARIVLMANGFAGYLERGDHYPEHADALQRRDDRVRAEVLAGVLERLDAASISDDGLFQLVEMMDSIRAGTADIPCADALKRALAEAREAGRREGYIEACDNKAAMSRYGGYASPAEVDRREREAAAKALDDVYDEVEARLGSEHGVGAALRIIDSRIGHLRAATGEGSDAE